MKTTRKKPAAAADGKQTTTDVSRLGGRFWWSWKWTSRWVDWSESPRSRYKKHSPISVS